MIGRDYLVEEELINYLRDTIPDIKRTKNKYEHYDCQTDRSIIELKSRRKSYDSYLIEVAKYEWLIREATTQGKTPFLIVTSPAGFYVFNLFTTVPTIKENYSTNKTDFPGGRVYKREQAFFDINDAVVSITGIEFLNIKEKYILD